MSARAATRRVRFVGAALILLLSVTTGYAEPPPPDALKMRNAPRASAALTTSPLIQEPSATATAQPAAAQPPVAPADVDPAKVERATKQATTVLQLCYELARRSDKALRGPITVQAGVRANGELDLRAQGESIGNGYFARCVERKLSALSIVSQLPETGPNTRVIVVGGAASFANR